MFALTSVRGPHRVVAGLEMSLLVLLGVAPAGLKTVHLLHTSSRARLHYVDRIQGSVLQVG